VGGSDRRQVSLPKSFTNSGLPRSELILFSRSLGITSVRTKNSGCLLPPGRSLSLGCQSRRTRLSSASCDKLELSVSSSLLYVRIILYGRRWLMRNTLGATVVMAKANMSELADYKSGNAGPGWSAIGGQTINVYVSRLCCPVFSTRELMEDVVDDRPM
jgi:hypothetical protein